MAQDNATHLNSKKKKNAIAPKALCTAWPGKFGVESGWNRGQVGWNLGKGPRRPREEAPGQPPGGRMRRRLVERSGRRRQSSAAEGGKRSRPKRTLTIGRPQNKVGGVQLRRPRPSVGEKVSTSRQGKTKPKQGLGEGEEATETTTTLQTSWHATLAPLALSQRLAGRLQRSAPRSCESPGRSPHPPNGRGLEPRE